MRHKFIIPIVCLLLASIALPADACTLWAAAGNRVAGGGALIAKNRDWEPDHRQEIRLIEPENGYKYCGIFAVGGDAPGLKAGINESGLVIVSASASVIPRPERLAMPHTKSLMIKILTRCATVDAALANRDWFLGPQFFILADRVKVAAVEVAPGGKIAVTTITEGTLAHTNHYLDPGFREYNRKIGISSQTRLTRIIDLLGRASPALTMNDFIQFSNDRRNGPDNSLWRTGSKTVAARTLSSWIIYLPPQSSPILHVKLANPSEAAQILELNIHTLFKDKIFLSGRKTADAGLQ